MDYERIEKLVLKAKENDKGAKEDIIKSFNPYILTISKNTHIYGYEFEDIKNECYKTVLYCIESYDPANKKFIGYALTSIRNSIKQLLKKSDRRKNSEGMEAFILNDNLELVLCSEEKSMVDFLCEQCEVLLLREAINSLKDSEQELIKYLFYDKKTLRSYAEVKHVCYTTAMNRKNTALNKLLSYMKRVPM
ncbi:MAG: polymerase sigma factor, sigma-70 family [Clostridiaceae bacterium]|jgi:RNA polymerase sigma factor (sigma-70 family)|nr:polymerase sigma factor, sigma-70 family [Clostridiaceae bacterium]